MKKLAAVLAVAAVASTVWVTGATGVGGDRPSASATESAAAAFAGPNGKIAFTRYMGDFRTAILTMNPAGTKVRTLIRNGFDPAWSADGRKIVFGRSVDGQSDLYRARADGKKARRLTKTRAVETDPAWSPDGKKIVFTRQPGPAGPGQPPSGTPDIYRMKADGTKVRRLTKSDKWTFGPAWSPDGKKVAFSLNGKVTTMKPDGSKKKRLASGIQPQWSPNGKQIAYSEGLSIWKMKANGADRVELTKGDPGGEVPFWSPDGKQIVYVGLLRSYDYLGIHKMSANGANQVALTQPGEGDPRRRGMSDFSPDWQPR